MAVIKISPNQIIKKKRKTPKGHAVDLMALAQVRSLLANESRQRDLLIEHLHKIQDKYQHISSKHLVALAYEMNLATAEVYEVASFYHHFDIIKEGQTPPPMLTVRVCESISCAMADAHGLIKALEKGLGDVGNVDNENKVRIQKVPCVGRCQYAPVAVVGQNPIRQATVESVITAIKNKAITEKITPYTDITQYKAEGGYQTLKQVIEDNISTESIMQKMESSGLRGLGGAGFPAGKKWRIVNQFVAPRMMAVNIDEGEPGTFKDRHYLETDPHRFLEGMLIAALTVDCVAIYIYLRDEYAGCREILTHEIANLQQNPPSAIYKIPAIYLRRGAGAYICGEESAMIESIEGKRGVPRLRPPFVAEVGLFGRPTLEHNMETLYWVRDIVEKSPDWFSAHGRHDRKGLRSFCVSGRINNPGVHLAPAGITARELIAEYCGGMQDGHTFYGYFPGGASGGILPESMADIPLDFDTLNQYGCFIGSAAIIVFSTMDSAKQLALNAMHFFKEESCGQCTPCRVGTVKASMLMQQKKWDTDLLEELASVMVDASICGLGQAAPNPLRCVIKYFPNEIVASPSTQD